MYSIVIYSITHAPSSLTTQSFRHSLFDIISRISTSKWLWNVILKNKRSGHDACREKFLICECPKSLEFKTILPEVVLPFEHLLQHHIDVYHYSVESSFEFFRLWLDWPYHLQMHLDYLNTMMNLCLNLES